MTVMSTRGTVAGMAAAVAVAAVVSAAMLPGVESTPGTGRPSLPHGVTVAVAPVAPMPEPAPSSAKATPGTITYAHGWAHRTARVDALHGPDFREHVLRLALLRCNAPRTRCLVQDIDTHSTNYGRRGYASGRAIGALNND